MSISRAISISGALKLRSALTPLIAVAVFGLLASACSSSTESTDAAADDTDAPASAESADTDGDTTELTEVAEVTIEGDALPEMGDNAEDPALGLVAPELTGTDIAGEPISITDDGRAKAIYFVAHWCPHCQDEVPVLTELIDGDRQPADLDIYAVSTAVDPSGDNFPPSAWLNDEGFPAPTLRDSEASEALVAFGAGGFPYVVYLDADHTVTNRTAGQLGADEIVELWTQTAG